MLESMGEVRRSSQVAAMGVSGLGGFLSPNTQKNDNDMQFER